MRKQIFKAIAEAVAAVPGVAFVDLWNNQVQTLNGGAAFPFAAVFIEFEAVEWKQQNMRSVGQIALGKLPPAPDI